MVDYDPPNESKNQNNITINATMISFNKTLLKLR